MGVDKGIELTSCIYNGPLWYVEEHLHPLYELLTHGDISWAEYRRVEGRSFLYQIVDNLLDRQTPGDEVATDPDTLFYTILAEAQRPIIDTGNQGIQVEIGWPYQHSVLKTVPEARIYLCTFGSSGTGRDSSPVGGFRPQHMERERYFYLSGSLDLQTCAKHFDLL